MDAVQAGDMDTAYAEVVSTGDDSLLVKLMDKSGPVFDQLSNEVAVEVLNAIMPFVAEQNLFDLCLSWVQQVWFNFFHRLNLNCSACFCNLCKGFLLVEFKLLHNSLAKRTYMSGILDNCSLMVFFSCFPVVPSFSSYNFLCLVLVSYLQRPHQRK